MLRSAYRALVAFGSLWALVSPQADLGRQTTSTPPKPGGVPDGHPERLCPDVELNEIEWALEYQLRDLA
jgi:hypothetical protein